MSSVTKARSMMSLAVVAMMAALAPDTFGNVGPSSINRQLGALPKRIKQRAFKKTSGNKPKSSTFSRQKDRIWVGGAWLYFRP